MHALISVSDKRHVVEFASQLRALGFTLLSTGGTYDALKASGIEVTKVSDFTGSPEILGGRVKTLHPKIHGGILARPNLPADAQTMKEHHLVSISVVAVNLYPFRETVAAGKPDDEVIENIDIGGPAMIRSAAKNAESVFVVVNPDDYAAVIETLKTKSGEAALKAKLRAKAFAHTAAYDASISTWLQRGQLADELALPLQRVQELRYGENPHQRGSFFKEPWEPKEPTVTFSKVLQGKELSYNNILDLDAALGLLLEFSANATAVVIKHNTPCGVATRSTITEAYRAARACDETSAFGGIVALNREVDAACATALAETFLEAVVAPTFSPQAKEILATKKNVRLLEAGEKLSSLDAKARSQIDIRSVSGGYVVMDRDAVEPESEWKIVSKRKPTQTEMDSMRFAWRVCKHVKSNAIVFSNEHTLLSQAGGQTSRVDSVKIATNRGGTTLKNSAVASDAFFPFRDGLDELAKSGASAVIQPGGSVRDAEVIAAADEAGIAMVFTGVRHFKH
jgi:phosphoribosylaminoimidazolecarboxamide formyltransferase / IMP cyclohydrolase